MKHNGLALFLAFYLLLSAGCRKYYTCTKPYICGILVLNGDTLPYCREDGFNSYQTQLINNGYANIVLLDTFLTQHLDQAEHIVYAEENGYTCHED